MSKMMLLKIHRWITLAFSIPLFILILTGLILSFEPAVTGTVGTGRVTVDSIGAVLAKHDPDAKARSLIVRGYAGTVSIGGAQRGALVHVDLARNEKIALPGALAELFTAARRLHETFLLDLGWLVTASTFAMLVLIALGLLMGWPRLRNTLAGWHKGTGWIALPLLILSPLTGLFLAYGITFGSPPRPAASGAPVTLAEAVRIVGAAHDLGRVNWIRPMGGTLLARLDDGGEMRAFAVTRNGLVAASRNWPRLLHEGNWGGKLSVLFNLVTSIALLTLLSTGLLLWARRKFRRRSRAVSPGPSAAPRTIRPAGAA